MRYYSRKSLDVSIWGTFSKSGSGVNVEGFSRRGPAKLRNHINNLKTILTVRNICYLATIDVNIAKQVSVISVLECAQLCLAQKSCEVFKYRDANHDAINCQVTQGKPEYFPTSEKDYANEKWKLYTLQIIESVRNYQINNEWVYHLEL